MDSAVRPEAVALLGKALDPCQRLLVLGATGWFGHTFLTMLDHFPEIPVLAVASEARAGQWVKRYRVRSWNSKAIEEFGPTAIANFAFLTRDRWSPAGDGAYRSTNRELTSRLMRVSVLPTVRAILTVSSGAAVDPYVGRDENPYGALKAAEEESVLSLATERRAVLVARAWSVSGPFVVEPRKYLFSDLVLQARTGAVVLRAGHPVYRRYVSVDDYLSVSFKRVLGGETGALDSGGPLVEARDLALRIADRAGSTVEFPAEFDESISDRYHSDNRAWTDAVAAEGYVAASLEEQIEIVANHLDDALPN